MSIQFGPKFGIIYCIGYTPAYRKDIRELTARGETPVKIGKRDDLNGEFYPGGSVWRTRQDAQHWLETLGPQWDPPRTAENFSVFGVDADWEKDTEPDPEHPFHNLLKDSPLIDLEA